MFEEDDQAGGDSSKSNSISSTQSIQSGGVSASSQGSSTNSLPPQVDEAFVYPSSVRGTRNVRVRIHRFEFIKFTPY